MKDIIKSLILEWWQSDISYVREREVEKFIPLDLPKVVALVGARRVGKTSLLYRLATLLESKGVYRKNTVYLNFADDRLVGFKSEHFADVLSAYRELSGNVDTCYMFLDEIFEVEGYERFVRRLVEREGCRVFITGSLSLGVKGAVHTALSGRVYTVNVYPLSFSEVLSWRGIDSTAVMSFRQKDEVEHLLDMYIKWGGFPEIWLYGNSDVVKRKILSDYLEGIVYRDLVSIFSIRKPTLARYVALKLLSQSGTVVSVNRLLGQAKSVFGKVSKDTIIDYISYLEDMFVIYKANKLSPSIDEIYRASFKVFSIDTGLKTITLPPGKEDIGQYMENVVAMKFIREGMRVFYAVVGNHEIDIIVETSAGYLPIVVYYTLEESRTIRRENKSVEIAKAFGEPIVVSRYGEKIKGVKTYSLRDFLLLPISSII